jgi:hypothetical protein
MISSRMVSTGRRSLLAKLFATISEATAVADFVGTYSYGVSCHGEERRFPKSSMTLFVPPPTYGCASDDENCRNLIVFHEG